MSSTARKREPQDPTDDNSKEVGTQYIHSTCTYRSFNPAKFVVSSALVAGSQSENKEKMAKISISKQGKEHLSLGVRNGEFNHVFSLQVVGGSFPASLRWKSWGEEGALSENRPNCMVEWSAP
jgi:hypothetical protein